MKDDLNKNGLETGKLVGWLNTFQAENTKGKILKINKQSRAFMKPELRP